jgi:hypothetical protein
LSDQQAHGAADGTTLATGVPAVDDDLLAVLDPLDDPWRRISYGETLP